MKKQLLEKYWKGESTLEEEQLLKAAIRGDATGISTEELQYFQEIQAFESLTDEEAFDMSLFPEKKVAEVKIVRIPLYQRLRNVAVIALLLLTAGLGMYNWTGGEKQRVSAAEEGANQQMAFDLAKASLLLVSQKMNKATVHLAALEKFDLAHDKIQQKSVNQQKSKTQ